MEDNILWAAQNAKKVKPAIITNFECFRETRCCLRTFLFGGGSNLGRWLLLIRLSLLKSCDKWVHIGMLCFCVLMHVRRTLFNRSYSDLNLRVVEPLSF